MLLRAYAEDRSVITAACQKNAPLPGCDCSRAPVRHCRHRVPLKENCKEKRRSWYVCHGVLQPCIGEWIAGTVTLSTGH